MCAKNTAEKLKAVGRLAIPNGHALKKGAT